MLLADASRNGIQPPTAAVRRMIEGTFGNDLSNITAIDLDGLTASEAAYLVNFRNADELRDRSAKARVERGNRLGDGLVSDADGQDGLSPGTVTREQRPSRAVRRLSAAGRQKVAQATNTSHMSAHGLSIVTAAPIKLRRSRG